MTIPPTVPSAQAQATTLMLQAATRAGRPMMIPGAAPIKTAAPAGRPASPTASPFAPVAAGDLQRLEYRREGGGGSGFRTGLGFLSIFAKLWRRG